MKKLFPLTTFQQDAVLKRLKELQEGVEDIVGINYEVDETSITTLTSNDIEDFLELKHKVIKWRLNTTSNYYYVYVLNASKSTNQPYMYKLTLVGVGENYGMLVDFTQQALTTISVDRIVNIGSLRAVTPNIPTSSGDTALTSLKVGSTNYKVEGGTKLYKHSFYDEDNEYYFDVITNDNTPFNFSSMTYEQFVSFLRNLTSYGFIINFTNLSTYTTLHFTDASIYYLYVDDNDVVQYQEIDDIIISSFNDTVTPL